MIIAVSGTPGTGKTTVARQLADRLSLTYVDVSALIDKHKLYDGFDATRDARIVDENALAAWIVKNISEGVIDSHLSHHLPPSRASCCVVCTCELKELEKRLVARGYDKKKVRENLDSEIFKTCETEAREAGHRVVVVDTTSAVDLDTLIAQLKV